MNYKKIILIVNLLFVITICFSQMQKRGAPKPVTSIIVNSIEYSAHMGYIVAKNINSDSTLWKKRIYEIHYIKNLETDVQWTWIDSIKLKNENLLIRNEKGKYYSLNLKSLIVTDIDRNTFYY